MASQGHQGSHRLRSRSLGDVHRTNSTAPHSIINVTEKRRSFKERFCSNDSTKFRKYIENTTTHGVVRIFTGKSRVRRLFWAVVFLSASIACLANIIERIIYLAGDPTTTTVTQKVNRDGIVFPAVTICNVNLFKKSTFESMVDENELSVLTDIFMNPSKACTNETTDYLSRLGSNISYRHIQDVARHQAEDLIVKCTYGGKDCNHTDFSEVLTRLGYCYTFNSGNGMTDKTLLKSQGIGTRYGLFLMLNIEQDEYLEWPVGLNAGVRVAIHPHDQPPVPEDLGIAIPPGRNVFIGIRQKSVTDTSAIGRIEGRCRDVEDTSRFNFLQERFQYSSTACIKDCLFTNITEECHCVETGINTPPASSRYHGRFPDCSAVDLCCILEFYNRATVSVAIIIFMSLFLDSTVPTLLSLSLSLFPHSLLF